MSAFKGGYSRQYQEVHREQLRLLNHVHRVSSESFKARARIVTKENERRRKALETKKEAFAKAEVERRKEALELRRKGQKEAVMHYKSVFKRPPVSHKSQNRKAQDMKVTHLHDTASVNCNDTQQRLAYGYETEITAQRKDMPSVDDLLRSLRSPAVQSCSSSDVTSTNGDDKTFMCQESKPTKEDSMGSNSSLSVMLNRKCSLSDTEILKLNKERLVLSSKPVRLGSPLRSCRSGSCDNFNFRALKRGAVAEEVLKELQCDSSLLQKTLVSNELYKETDLSDSLDIPLNDSLEKQTSSGDSTEVAWIVSHQSSQVDQDNSVLSVVSACESNSYVQEIAEHPSILKTSRFKLQKDFCVDTYHGGNKVVKKVRFQDQPSTMEIQTYITKQPSYLSQIPTFQTPISRAMSYKSNYSKPFSHQISSNLYSGNRNVLLPKHDSSTSNCLVPSNPLVHCSDSSEFEKAHNLSTITPPTDDQMNPSLWGEVRSFFRNNSANHPPNGLRLNERISVDNSGHLVYGGDSRAPVTTQIRAHPVTHLSRSKQATSSRMNSSDQLHKSDIRRCISPVQITFSNSQLCDKEAKASDSHELLIKEQKLQQSLDRLNSRLKVNSHGGIKYGSSTSVMKKKHLVSPMTKDFIYARGIHHRSSHSYPPSDSY